MKSKSNFRKLLISAVMCLMITTVHAQSNVIDAYIAMDSISSSLFAGTYFITLNDTNDIDEFEIKLGSATGESDIIQHTYDFDVTTGLPTGWTYSRVGQVITLGIGNYTEKSIYFGSVRTKNLSGTWSGFYDFISN